LSIASRRPQSRIAPDAWACPPPPNSAARSVTVIEPLLRKLILVLPFLPSENNIARRTPCNRLRGFRRNLPSCRRSGRRRRCGCCHRRFAANRTRFFAGCGKCARRGHRHRLQALRDRQRRGAMKPWSSEVKSRACRSGCRRRAARPSSARSAARRCEACGRQVRRCLRRGVRSS